MLRCLLLVLLLVACAAPGRDTSSDVAAGTEAVSLLGEPLVPPPLPDSIRAEYERRLAEAERDHANAPGSADAAIWVGRRLAYLGRYREAIDTFTAALARHPDDPRLYRHRGHRYITTRQLDRAVADLERAAGLVRGTPDEVEPDGLPNARNIPTSTLHSNIWYHLGLAHYLRGEFARAADAYREALRVSANPDMLVATTHWAYMTRRRLRDTTEAARLLAPISREMDVIENDAYHRLLLMYRGELTADSLMAPTGADGVEDATVGYGVANWHLYNGRGAEARALLERIVAGPQWAAFGYIAAEAELARISAR